MLLRVTAEQRRSPCLLQRILLDLAEGTLEQGRLRLFLRRRRGRGRWRRRLPGRLERGDLADPRWLVMFAIPVRWPTAVEREPRGEITGSRWQASTHEVRNWARSAGFEPHSDGSIPEQAITAYNQTHPDRPY